MYNPSSSRSGSGSLCLSSSAAARRLRLRSLGPASERGDSDCLALRGPAWGTAARAPWALGRTRRGAARAGARASCMPRRQGVRTDRGGGAIYLSTA